MLHSENTLVALLVAEAVRTAKYLHDHVGSMKAGMRERREQEGRQLRHLSRANMAWCVLICACAVLPVAIHLREVTS